MNIADKVQNSIQASLKMGKTRDGVHVTTQCLYPSNTFVRIFVRGGDETFFVSDEGGAIRDVESAGAWLEKPDRLIAPIVSPFGLKSFNGIVASREISTSDLGIAIAIVANASKNVAEYLFSHLKVKPTRNFKEVLSAFLRTSYDDAVREETFVGQSNKAHKFENVIVLHGKKLVVDPVINDRSSINARLVANMDLKAAKHEGVEQRIIYDDRENWQPEDLNLLQVGARVVPYSKAPQVIQRLAS